MCHVSYHSPAVYLVSAIISGLSSEVFKYLHHATDLFNHLVDTPNSLTYDSVDNSSSPLTQKFLSNKFEDSQFRKRFHNSTLIDRARILSISSSHASAWLSVTPSPSVGLHLELSEFQVAINGGSVSQLLMAKVALNVMLPWMLMAIMLCVASWGVMLSLVTTG